MLDSKIRFGLISHRFKGCNHFGEREEIKLLRNAKWPLGQYTLLGT